MSILNRRILALHENNPMLGHRGVRLGISYPEITEMQVRAIIFRSGMNYKRGCKSIPRNYDSCNLWRHELSHQKKAIVDRVYDETIEKNES